MSEPTKMTVTLDETWNALWRRRGDRSFLRHARSPLSSQFSGQPEYVHCCLGIACLQAGYTEKQILSVGMPSEVEVVAPRKQALTMVLHRRTNFGSIASINDYPESYGHTTPAAALAALREEFRDVLGIKLVIPKKIEAMYAANWARLTGAVE